MGREEGWLTEEQLREIDRYRDSDAFDETERLVLDLATALSRSPADVPGQLFEELAHRFDERALVELAAMVAWENYRARFNRAFGLEPQGFSEGAFCPLPARDG